MLHTVRGFFNCSTYTSDIWYMHLCHLERSRQSSKDAPHQKSVAVLSLASGRAGSFHKNRNISLSSNTSILSFRIEGYVVSIT